jgi:hypothetical protein
MVNFIVYTMKSLIVGTVALTFKRNNNVVYSFITNEITAVPSGNNVDQKRRRCRKQNGYQRNDQLLHPSIVSLQRQCLGYNANAAIGLRGGSSISNDGGGCNGTNNSNSGSVINSTILATTAQSTIRPIMFSSSPSPSLLSSYYYLLWSPGFFKEYGIMSATLFGVYMSGWDHRAWKILSRQWTAVSAWVCCMIPAITASSTTSQPLLQRLPSMMKMIKIPSTIPNFVLPLLSSSCCIIQLAINMLVGAGGCAGFNTILGPVRPYLLAFLTYMNVMTGATIKQWIFRYVIAFMPEGVYFWNEYQKLQWLKQAPQHHHQQRRQQSTSSSSSSSASSVLVGSADNNSYTTGTRTTTANLQATVIVDIPTMGCVACINKIESNLRQQLLSYYGSSSRSSSSSSSNDDNSDDNSNNTNNDTTIQWIGATSWLETTTKKKGGRAKVDFYVDSPKDVTIISQKVVDIIEQAGFHGTTIYDIHILPVPTILEKIR